MPAGWLSTKIRRILGLSVVMGEFVECGYGSVNIAYPIGILEIDNNTAERAMKSVAIGHKNRVLAGS